jgi:hypothetical protein
VNSDVTERERALSILESQMNEISVLFKRCYLSSGRGVLLLYAQDVKLSNKVTESSYRTEEEALDLFDNEKSKSELKQMVREYEPKEEGILVLITKSNATWFVTCKLK